MRQVLPNLLGFMFLRVNLECPPDLLDRLANCGENAARICARRSTEPPEPPERTCSRVNTRATIRKLIQQTTLISHNQVQI